MAVAFARTTRSLKTDDFRVPRLVWLMAAILLAAWIVWFFTAQVPAPSALQPGAKAAIERVSPARLAFRALERPLKASEPKPTNIR